MTPQDKLIFVDTYECYKIILNRLTVMRDAIYDSRDEIIDKMSVIPKMDCDHIKDIDDCMRDVIDIAHSINRIIEEIKEKED